MSEFGAGRACALLCEYNPFHFGHFYQLRVLHRHFSVIVCLLGGNLSQRGEVAVSDRYVRARAALAGGADLVLELPAPWCCASAREFASGGVRLAIAVGADSLAFSAESEPEALYEAAKRREAAEEAIHSMIRERGSLSYPAAAERVLGRALAGCPNDILAIEYLRAAGGFPSYILRREPSFASSTEIRAAGTPPSMLPEETAPFFVADPSFPRETERVGSFLLASLRNQPPADCYGVPEELLVRMKRIAAEETTFSGFVRRCQNKMYTAARVRRAAWAEAFRFPAELPKQEVPYTLLLAANEVGRNFLRRTAKTRTVPVISRPAICERDEALAPVFSLNSRINGVLRLFYGGPDDREQRPVLQ